MDESLSSIMEVREDFMVSPDGDSKPTLRSAYFLKPLAKSLEGSISEVLSTSMNMPLPPVFEPKKWPLVVHFSCWRSRKRKWVEWVDALRDRYESVWKKVGIFEAIMSTKCSLVKDRNLCIGVAEKWCPQTNTILFPWGEATITLEDVMVLGGYPVVGDPIFTTLQSQEMIKVQEKLILARKEPWKRNKGKVSLSAWMDIFRNSGSEIEHEAFLATWLTMVGFSPNDCVNQLVFPIAIHLARGNPIALGPTVLASIYQDLSLLKETVVDLTKKLILGDNLELEVTLRSPFYLVQIWGWERFKNFQPQPRVMNPENPWLYRWHKVKALNIDNVRLALDSGMEHFRWRPYVQYADRFNVFYPENETLVPLETDLDKKLVPFVTCLKVSVLVGVQYTIKKYMPHRVAMQFGMDQDIPGCVPEFNGSKEFAWRNYCRPISNGKLYFPARLFEGDVTTSYAKWWKQSVLPNQHDFAKNIVQRKRSLRSRRLEYGNDADVPPGFPPKLGGPVYSGKSNDDASNARKRNSDANVPSDFLLKRLKTVPSGNSAQDGFKDNENIDAEVPARYKNLSNQSSSASTADYENAKRMSPQEKLVGKDTVNPLKEDVEDANGRKEARLSIERVSLSGAQGESYNCVSGMNVIDLEQRIKKLKTVTEKLKIAKFGYC
ncbi:uncharacterized protein HKW66_Vig0182120 [Vigna angularis]|uniref:Aminotransferase-like plant mobile domain-containing protein n=2 Tax=Phaseolus angularis TaxID=3914 RepID=A0A8T0K3Y9_PHAAN|nr:uncharacterized protein LOC108342103 [Vigna angularis]KAG2394410.1 uncharacterized protein HKW66_Vig0182120 [Vigna angularis]BAT88897.1 hypothetical protein VIGAN_05254200 [Vigna angularis var. angularis]